MNKWGNKGWKKKISIEEKENIKRERRNNEEKKSINSLEIRIVYPWHIFIWWRQNGEVLYDCLADVTILGVAGRWIQAHVILGTLVRETRSEIGDVASSDLLPEELGEAG